MIDAPTKEAPKYDDQQDASRLRDLDRWFDDVWRARDEMLPWWKVLYKNIIPRRLDLGDGQRSGNSLRAKNDVKDRTATRGLRVAVSGMLSGMSPPWRKWWELEAPKPSLQKDREVRIWLQAVTDAGHLLAHRAGFYTTLIPTYEDEFVGGTGAMFIFEEEDERMARCEHIPLGSYSVAKNARREYDSFCRRIVMTIRQAVEEFGMEQLSGTVQQAYKQGHFEKPLVIHHGIYPNREYMRGAKGQRGMRFAESYWECDTTRSQSGTSSLQDTYFTVDAKNRKELRRGGYYEFPVIVFTWGGSPSDPFGTECPAMDALEDILTLQEMRRKGFNALDKQIDPPVQIPSGMEHTPISMLPGGRTRLPPGAAAAQGIKNLHEAVQIRLADLREDVADVREAILEAFHYRTFYGILADERGTPPTAAEIYERRRQSMSVLGPIQERNTRGGYDLAVNRLTAILYRRAELDWIAGVADPILPPPPEALQGAEPRTIYKSEVALAQSQDRLGAARTHIQTVLGVAPIVPSVTDGIKWDDWLKEERDQLGILERLSNSPDEIQAIRQQRAEQEHAMEAAKAARGVGSAVKDLGNTDLREGTALSRILEGV